MQTCEIELEKQDFVVYTALKRTKEDGILIVILRLGDIENSHELMRRRLYNVRQYFKNRGSALKPEKIIIAEGEKVKGNGRIEYYLDGKLQAQLLFPKNHYICHSCCGPDGSYYPEKLRYDRQQMRKQKRVP